MGYVGGIDATYLQQLMDETGNHLSSFKCGASLLIQSRYKAGTASEDTSVISNYLFGLTCTEIDTRLKEIEPKTDSLEISTYFEWIEKINHNFN